MGSGELDVGSHPGSPTYLLKNLGKVTLPLSLRKMNIIIPAS